MENNKCIIWGNKLPESSILRIGMPGIYTITNPRAGIKYQISIYDFDTSYKPTLFTNDNDRIRISGYIAKQNLEKKIPKLSSIIKKENFIETLPPIPNPTERAYLLLEGLVKKTEYFGQTFILDSLKNPEVNAPSVYPFLHAISYCNYMTEREIKSLIDFLNESNFIKINSLGKIKNYSFQATAQGFDKVHELYQFNHSKTAFIAMWFDKSMNHLRDSIEKAVKNTGYNPVRIDNKEHLNKIDDEILLEIKKSRFIICDLTSEKEKPRGSVYFEAGYAMGKNIPIIWTCDKRLEKERAFDIQNYNCLFWEKDNLDDFIERLQNRIGNTIGALKKE